MTHPASYTQIRRGPMGGDHYTKIHNGVFRDRALTPLAKAIFGWGSTHAEGWGTSITAAADAMNVSYDTAKRAIKLLKRRHYLVFGQDRTPQGTVGQGWYFLTDLPAQLAQAGVTDDTVVASAVEEAVEVWQRENRWSGPVGQIHPTGGLSASVQVGTGNAKTAPPVEPLAVGVHPKKTKEPQEDQGQENQDLDFEERRSKEHMDYRPSTLRAAGILDFQNDQREQGATAAIQTGVQPRTPQDVTAGAAAGAVDVGRQGAAADDHDGDGVPRDAHGTPLSPIQREREFYEAYPECLGITREERAQTQIEQLAGWLEPSEEHAMHCMLDQGAHPRKIANTILKQREAGHA